MLQTQASVDPWLEQSRQSYASPSNNPFYKPRQCVRCHQERLLTSFPPDSPTASCRHAPTVCSECLSDYAKRSSGGHPVCPDPSCWSFMTSIDVQRVLGMLSLNHEQATRDEFRPAELSPTRDASLGSGIDESVGVSTRNPFLAPQFSAFLAIISKPLPPIPLPDPPPVVTRSCVVCLDDVPSTDFPPRSPTSTCAHEPTACSSCLRQHIQSRINDSNPAIPCPTCSTALEFNDVRYFVDQEDFDRYDAMLLRQQLSAAKEFVWCLNPACGAGQLHLIQDGEVIVICSSCGSKSCFIHSMSWHTGLTCAEYDALQRQTEQGTSADQEYLRRHTKACPACGIAIQKNEGCDHMTCRPPGGCGHQFCWSCLADWTAIIQNGNHRHRRECTFYRALPGAREEPRVAAVQAAREAPRAAADAQMANVLLREIIDRRGPTAQRDVNPAFMRRMEPLVHEVLNTEVRRRNVLRRRSRPI